MTIQVANVTTAGNTVYTSSGNSAITWLSMCNYDTGNSVTANVYVVPNGNTASATNIVAANLSISGGDTYQIYAGSEKLLLGNGDFISIRTSANTLTSVTSYTSI